MKLPRIAAPSPAVRLTAWYVAVLTCICLSYSLTIYQFASNQIADSLRHQYAQLHPMASPPSKPPDNGDALDSDSALVPLEVRGNLEDASHNLIAELIYINAIIIGFGGAISYWFAKRTVRPIEESLEAQSRFTADASHELRTPLAVMQMELELAQDDADLTLPQAKALLSSSLEEVGKLRALSDGLLQLAQIDRPLPKAAVSLKHAADQATRHVAAQAQTHKAHIKNEARDIKVRVNAASLIELLSLLMDNAIKYSPEGSVVTVSTRVLGRHADISVADLGRGIAREDLPYIFDRFYRADKSRTGQDVVGHGLGLSIAKRIADLQDGRFRVSSEVGKGTIFTVSFPLA
jgi:signal transduction histidine kinase